MADEVRRYTVGDEIHLNVRVGHNMNLTGLRVVFTHVRDPDIEFEFWGEVALHQNYKRLQDGRVCSEPNYHL